MDLKYFGDILLHKILRKNLPGRVAGDHLFFTKDENDRYSLFVNDKDGSLKECTYNEELAKQIGVLPTLKTVHKEDLVGAINENNEQIKALNDNKVDKTPIGYLTTPTGFKGLGVINTLDTSTDTPPISDGWGTYLNSGGLRDFQLGYKWNDDKNRLWYRTHRNDADYCSWKQIATTDKIDISPLLVNGWTKDGYQDVNSAYAFKNGNIVTVNACLRGGVTTEGTILFTLPVGYRPTTSNVIVLGGISELNEPIRLSISTTGEVKIRNDKMYKDRGNPINFSFGIV